MDYSVYDAIRAGFGKVIFVIRNNFRQDFEKRIKERYGSSIEFGFVEQEKAWLIDGMGTVYKGLDGRWWITFQRTPGRGSLTLLFAARDERCNNAQVLAEFLEEELERRGPPSSPVCYADQ